METERENSCFESLSVKGVPESEQWRDFLGVTLYVETRNKDGIERMEIKIVMSKC